MKGFVNEEMSDYIKREDALNAFRRVYMIPGRGTAKEIYTKQIENTYKQIESVPSADVVDRESYESMERTVHKLTDAITKTEHKHGKWLDVTTLDNEFICWVCSECRHGADFVYEPYNFCPQCGARMDL